MTGALFYLFFHSWKNRTAMRIRRLKRPKYLAGAIVGGLYFYFYFFRFALNPSRYGKGGGMIVTPENLPLLEGLGALILCVIVVLAWVLPNERAARGLSEAEVAVLFPAPVSRRALVHFKLLKSQIAILFMVLFLTVIFGRFLAGGVAWLRAVSWWVIFSTLRLHTLGSSFARTLLLERGISHWKRRLVVLTLAAAAAGAVALWGRHTIPTPDPASLRSMPDLEYYLRHALDSGPLPYLLYPFRLVARPYLAASVDFPAFLRALWPALLLLAMHYWWVVRSDVAFEEASVEASRKAAERVAAIRANRGHTALRPKKKKRAPFELKPAGPRTIGFLWKNLIGAGQMFTPRFWLAVALPALILGVSFGGKGNAPNAAMLIGIVSAMFLLMSFLMGPQLVRQDFRQDLPMADLLKTYPLRGWEVALGELLGPAAILTGVQWLLIILCAGLFRQFGDQAIPWNARMAIGSGLALVAPMLNLVTLIIPNATVLLFPGWFQTGKDAPQGIEAMGQRLIFALGQLVVLLLSLVPAAALFSLIYFVARVFLGRWLPVPMSGLAAAAILGAEAWMGMLWLGRLFTNFDLSSESAG